MAEQEVPSVQPERGFVAFLRRIAMVLASGYILMFFSEFYFLNEGPGADFAEHWRTNPLGLAGWLTEFTIYYAAWGAIMLVAIGRFRVRTFWSIIIAGSIFGWAVEGIMIPVVYEGMPGSISWPSVGWHALVDVWLGWYIVRRILQKNNYLYTALTAIGLGLFWGVWCTWYWVDTPREALETAPLPAGVYAPYTIVLGVVLIACYIVMDKLGGRQFRPTTAEVVLLALWHIGWFVLGAAQQAPVSIVVLPALFLGGFFLLWWNRRAEPRPDLFASFTERVGWGQYALLLLIPACAIPVYLPLYYYDVRIPILQIVGVPLSYAGHVVLVVSALVILIRGWRQGGPPQSRAQTAGDDG